MLGDGENSEQTNLLFEKLGYNFAGLKLYTVGLELWRNTNWTRLDKCQGPPGSRGPKPEIT